MLRRAQSSQTLHHTEQQFAWLEPIKSEQGIEDLRDAKATIELASMVCKLLKVCQTFQLHHSDAIMCRIIPL